MRIVVCIKRVPDTETRIRVDGSGKELDRTGVKFGINPYDEFAVEAALRLAEARGDGSEVIALSLGDASAQEVLRTALAMGADRAIHLQGAPSEDGLETAKRIAAGMEGLAPDLILLGVKAADDDQQQVGPMLATLLGRPCVTSVSSFELSSSEALEARREVEGGTERVMAPLPAVLTLTKGPYEPRYPSLKGIMAAKKKPLEEHAAPRMDSRLTVQALELPEPRTAGRFIGQGVQAIPELVRRLREEAGAL